MKGYAKQALQQFKHPTPTKHHYEPTKYLPPEYGKKTQYNTEDTSPELTQLQRKHIQKICGNSYMTEDLLTARNYMQSTNSVSKQQQRQKRHKKHSHNVLTTVQAIPM